MWQRLLWLPEIVAHHQKSTAILVNSWKPTVWVGDILEGSPKDLRRSLKDLQLFLYNATVLC